MAEKLKTALLQAELVWEDPEANKEYFQKEINSLSQDVDLIILPEMFTTGFSMNAEKLAEEHQGPSFRWMQKMASEKDAAITGSIITSEKGHFYNRLYFVFPDGTSQKYDKRHTFTLAGENEVYASGSAKLIVTYKDWKICPLVCYDLRFPVWSRNTEDYDLLLFVANWPAPRVHAWDVLLQARAIENMSYCIGVNRVGRDGKDLDYVGHSAVYDSLGKQVSPKQFETVFTKEVVLEKDHLKQTRTQLRFLQDRDSFTVH
ncbi:amidohydrolase [Salinimicrobium flavum]|uniref:Amidohydrolase n=1 Tax=Salinimicrobium flavum TaxID=1737065 RepID=A0ABW5IWK9_9FLAO